MKNVKITKKYILMKYDNLENFKNELFIYLLAKEKNIDYIPKMIEYSCNKLYIKTENVGVTLEFYCEGCGYTEEYLKKIKIIYDKFIKLGYYHNDLRLKNIIINPDTKKLYLIDFEFTDIKYKDLDNENIVKKIRNLSKTKSKSR